MEFLPEVQEEVFFYEKIPARFEQYLIPGFTKGAYRSSIGDVCSQRFRVGNFLINYHVFDIQKAGTLHPSTTQPLFTIHYMYEGTVEAILNGRGGVKLQEREYNKFFVPANRHHAYFTPGMYRSIHIDLLPGLYSKHFEELGLFKTRLQYVSEEIGVIFNERPITIKETENQLLTDILNCRLTGSQQVSYLQERCVELLMQFLNEYFIVQQSRGNLSPVTDQMLANLLAAKEWIINHLHTQISPAKLAVDFNLKKNELITGFVQIFAQSLADFIRYQRLVKAGYYLKNTNWEIGTIATSVGYTNLSSFEKDFRHFFGYAPQEIRK